MESIKFEEAMKRLEKIVEQLETGDLELDEAVKTFEEGINLSLFCRQELDKAEGKINLLLKNLRGEFELQELCIKQGDGSSVT